MDLRHLQLVRILHQHQTLTKAGEILFLTQSALSHQLKEVESFFGATLFSRVGKKMVITQAGQAVLASAEKVLCEIENCQHDIVNLTGGKKGKLKLSTACYTSYHWLSSFLRQFALQYPSVELDILPEATNNTVEFLETGRLDIAILDYLPESTALKTTRIFDDELLLITSTDHPLATRKFINPHDLVDETYIMYTSVEGKSLTYAKLFTSYNIRPKQVKKMQLTEGIIELVKAGLGVAVLAKWSVLPYLERKELAGLRITRSGFRRSWYVATLKDKMQPKFVEDFAGYICRYFPSKMEEVCAVEPGLLQ